MSVYRLKDETQLKTKGAGRVEAPPYFKYMKEEKDDIVSLIPLEMRTPELEEQVKRYMQIIPKLPENKIKHTRVKLPNFRDMTDKAAWENEQIRRINEGWNGMTGKMYFWFNFCYIKNLKGGRIAPEFRVADNAWFSELDEAKKTNEGIVCVKRRRAGFSWKAAADALHDVMFNKYFVLGMNSKSERDSVHLFQKVLFIYDNLPQFLRARVGSKRGMKIEFFRKTKDKNGNPIRKGVQSEINVVPPTDSAYEGLMLGKWICDEAGKIPNLPQLWSFTEDTMMQETERIGQPILFGTSGDIGKDGRGLLGMWENSDVYRLRRFFFGGWMGMLCDDFGNDRVEEVVRWIVYERKRRESLPGKFYSDFLQKYPLTAAEAFNQHTDSGIGDIALINAQLASLRDNPVISKKGYFELAPDGGVRFIVSPNGKVIMYEEPDSSAVYVSGADPADHDDAIAGASDLSLHIVKKPDGTIGPKIVLEYVDRPDKLEDYYNQSYLALLYYGKTKCLIERNRYRMISHFNENGWQSVLATPPQGLSRLVPVRTNVIGVHMNEEMRKYMKGIITDYVDHFVELIPSKELLQEFIAFGAENTDRVFSFGMAMILLKEDKRSAKNTKKKAPTYRYKKVNGRITRVNE